MSESWAWESIEGADGAQMQCLDIAADGTLWIGLRDGVARYDGTRLEKMSIPGTAGDSAIVISIVAIDENHAYSIHRRAVYWFDGERWLEVYQGLVNSEVMNVHAKGDEGAVWVSTAEGVLHLKDGQSFFRPLPEEGSALSTLCLDHMGNVWTVEMNGGRVYRCPVRDGLLAPSDEWEVMRPAYSKERTPRYSMLQTRDGRIWVANTAINDLTQFYDYSSGEWESVDFDVFGGYNMVQMLAKTRDGMLWVCANGYLHGLMDGEWQLTERLSRRQLRSSLLEAHDGYLWLLQNGISLSRIDYQQKRWSTLNDLLFQCETEVGDQWFLDEEGSVIRHRKREGGVWWIFDVDDGVIDTPYVIKCARDGKIWVAGAHEGVAAVSVFDATGWRRVEYPQFGDALRHESLLELEDGRIVVLRMNYQDWLYRGTAGLALLSKNGDLIEDSLKPSSEVSFVVRNAGLKSDGSMYLARTFRMTELRDGIEYAVAYDDGIGGFEIEDLAVDSSDAAWLANWGQGVYRRTFDGAWSRFGLEDGLPSLLVSDIKILEDDSIFAVTSEGVARFDGDRWFPVLKEYASSSFKSRLGASLVNGKQGALWINEHNEFWLMRGTLENAYRQGEGGLFRTTRYLPERIAPDTQLSVIHEPNTRDRSLYVKLHGTESGGGTQSSRLYFSYRLDGGEWSEYSQERSRIFQQLDDGEHMLEVRARDLDFNVDPSPATYRFTIPPPFWKTGWFFALNTVVICTIAGLVFAIFRQRYLHLIEYDEQRIHFFTNISHELRTPLALILTPLEKFTRLRKDVGEEGDKDVNMALKSARRLHQLVDELLDFRRIEEGRAQWRKVSGDLVAEMRELVNSFKPLAEMKSQLLEFRCHESRLVCEFDSDKLQKILGNLLSNAIKYTPKGGGIRMTLEIERWDRSNNAVLRVEDSGRGISKERQKYIFEPFYRGNSKAAREATGTGLGLSLVKQLVGLAEGEISVSSPILSNNDEYGGTEFKVSIPVGEVREDRELPGGEPHSESDLLKGKELSILLVEDSDDLRRYLAEDLSQEFDVLLARDGEEGLRKAGEQIPDLIITDVMMPKMDGIELCRELKSRRDTNHIPVIMLTARSSSEFEELGLESGAEEYLPKPVSMLKLQLRIRNLLESRSRLQSRLKHEFLMQPNLPEPENKEESFLKSVVDYLDENLTNSTFGVDELAERLELSRSSFYRKLKAVANMTPQEFIKNYKMKRAGQLLLDTDLSVIEIVNEVGYSETRYFGKLFKGHFGCSPSEYRTRNASGMEN
ncbi:ATP-binding protein [Pelagicoccus mobilis]|uniref:histidine kinase n=1 Tax=Pelagicoccus mobilis TaxID=415221 RepID=A0A934RSH0_9BACT|nr:ATP-binding protein [Pelagicoccus mobilis]MBK1876062.1 response regulator [Pelagicoccus mobilis]